MLLNYLHAALAALLLAGSTRGLSAKQPPKPPLTHRLLGFNSSYVHIPTSPHETFPRLTFHSPENTPPTPLKAWSPASNNSTISLDPSKIVGKLQWSNGVFATASLVGPRHILTARHCSPQGPDLGTTVTFEPAYDHGDSIFGSATVQHTYMVGDVNVDACRTKFDHAVMVLSERFGDELGWFGVTLPDPKKFNEPVFSTRSYPGNREDGAMPFAQQGNITIPQPWIVKDDAEQLDCDTTGPIVSLCSAIIPLYRRTLKDC